MVLCIKANGWLMRTRKMVEVFRFGLMDQGTMDSGGTEWPMDMEDLCMLRVTFTRENGPKIKQMVMEFTLILMEADMKVNGFKINNMDLVSNNGLTAPSTRVNTSKE